MQKKTWILLLLLLVFVPYFGICQECFEYHKTACTPVSSKYTYDVNSSSVSFLFIAGQKRQVPLILYAGKDYRITVCGNNVFNDVILFKIVKQDGAILYDNSTHNYLLDIEFASKESQQVLLDIEVPDIEAVDSLKPKGCIGILIEDMVSLKTGF